MGASGRRADGRASCTHPPTTMARILLIDDDESFRTMLRLTLVQMGHIAIEAGNGAEGLKLFSNAEVDLVITDIVMPDKDGLDVVMTLRQQPPVKIIAMSGDQGRLRAVENLRAAQLLGATSVLAKPFNREALARAINEALASGPALARPAPVPLSANQINLTNN